MQLLRTDYLGWVIGAVLVVGFEDLSIDRSTPSLRVRFTVACVLAGMEWVLGFWG